MKKTKRTKSESAAFPCRLREIRKVRGYSVVSLAHEAGVAQDKILYIETKRGEGQPLTHIKLAKALGVSMDEYFGFPTLEPVSANEPELVASDPGVTVEQLAPMPGSAVTVKRIQVAAQKQSNLTRYLDPKRPIFFYLAQGEAKIWLFQKEHLLRPGDHLGLSLPGKVRLENLTTLPLVFLAVQ